MTTREYFEAVLNSHISDDMDAMSTALIEKLDARNEKRKSADSKAKAEVLTRVAAVRKFLSDNPDATFTRDAISQNLENITPAQAQAACKKLLEEGVVEKSEEKIDKSKKTVYQWKKS